MFENEDLENHLTFSHTIKHAHAIWAEWNMNQSYNISRVGNYRYRPASGDPKYATIRTFYDTNDEGGYYTGGTDSDIIINAGFDDIDEPAYHIAKKRKMNLLYSLDDCFKPHRPRSGINKMLYLGISGQGAGYAQYIDALTTFKPIENYDITDATILQGSDNKTYIRYTSQHRFIVGDSVQITGITVNGYAYITIAAGLNEGTYDSVNNSSIYVGQEVLGTAFPAGTTITGLTSGGQITFSNAANSTLSNSNVSFTGTGTSEFNFYSPKRVIAISDTTFTVQADITRMITYYSGGSAALGYSGTVNVARRPRYYMSSRYDDFKYWTSYRTEVENDKTNEYGISVSQNTGGTNPSYYIYDAAPFVVYNGIVPANRLIVKMQTNVGDINYGPYRMSSDTSVSDPLYGESNMTTPRRWAVQILDENNQWIFVKSFSDDDTRSDGSPIVGSDGYVELEYGIDNPDIDVWGRYFVIVDTVNTTSILPDFAPYGYAYLYKTSDTDRGELWVSDGSGAYQKYTPTYSWKLVDSDITKSTNVIKKLVDPDYYIDGNGNIVFREIQYIKGIRIVVDTMNKVNSTFDLIEMSPRLVADISEKVSQFSIKKVMSDLANHSMPTGNLIASTGSMTIFDEELAFNENNTMNFVTNKGSIIAPYLDSRPKFMFYDVVKEVDGIDYYIPLKILYADKNPQVSDVASIIDFELRDFFFYLESKRAPEMLLAGVSLSYAITVLLDNIGFSNYVFKRNANEDDLNIPYFFVGAGQNVAEVLEQLAISAQAAMFFDEYNNLVVMSKNYLLADEVSRSTDIVFYGQEEAVDGGTALPNIINIASREKKVYNSGELNYTTRYIQRSIGSIAQAPYVEAYKTYIYKPVLLWEIAGQENIRTINEDAQQSQGYSLAAAPIKTTLTADIPEWDSVNQTIKNNIIDFGENVYWLGNHRGYFYANGEVIKYDAVEYSVAGVGNVWITNNQEYQNYFSRLKFNGKMYPTGRVRIYSKLNGTTIEEHGRGQFGTSIVEHQYGIPNSSPWVNKSNVRGFIMNSKDYLFTTNPRISYPTMGTDAAGNHLISDGILVESQPYADKSTRNSIIKNFMAKTDLTETDILKQSSALAGSVQTSALVFNGPSLPSDVRPSDYVTYAYKTMVDSDGTTLPYTHFGTRMRIIGKIESSSINDQTPIGSYPLYSPSELTSTDPTKQVAVEGGSGGIAFSLNSEKNIGYFYEIVALTQNNLESFKNNSNSTIYNVLTSPVTQATSDSVIVSLNTQHDFEVGTKVAITGLIDDNRKTSPTALNGEYTVTEISQDRKQFKYTITPPANTTASITNVARAGSGTTWTITYTTSTAHSFRVGHLVTITGLAPTGYNVTNASITSIPSTTSFTVIVAADPGSLTDITGTATYVPLTTISSAGGTVTKIEDSETIISDVFFYKVVSGYNEADIIRKAKSGYTATLTTLRDHSLLKGEQIVVAINDAAFDGTFTITGVTANTITYDHTTTGTVTEADLSVVGNVTSTNNIAIPVILWRGLTEIIVDSGAFVSQSRLNANDKTTVYDLSAEYLNIGSSRKFFLYLNGKQIATVTDLEPLREYNNIALFVRGGSRVMFENIYALADNFAENQSKALQLPVSKIFADDIITEAEAINKYAISGLVQSTYLSGISSESTPRYSLYYEEFGTIMREAAYFNIKYDKAFPALYSTIASTLNRTKGYSVSGYFAGSYGAEFIIFNTIDKNLNLDDTTGNYLRILGVAFTQNTTHSLKVDDYFKKNSNFVNSLYSGGEFDANEYQALWTDIQNSRNKYGVNDFSIEAPFIQTDAAAEEAMDWIIKKTMKPRQIVGLTTFATPHVQLGDIATIHYKNNDNFDVISPETTRYVVYAIEYSKSDSEASSKVYLAEV